MQLLFFILGYFFALLPPNNPKNENFKKMKKALGDIINLHNCTKNHDHVLYCCSWDMARGRCNCYFLGGYFLPLAPSQTKKSNFTMKIAPGDHYTHVYQKLWLDVVRFLRYGSRQMDGRTRTDRQHFGKFFALLPP